LHIVRRLVVSRMDGTELHALQSTDQGAARPYGIDER
jgi:hypothetical protein